jgi:hypothetical protein
MPAARKLLAARPPAGGGGGGPLWEDDFNRANGAYSDPDVTVAGGSWQIVSNRLTNTTNYATASVRITGPTFNDNQWVRFTWDVADGYTSFISLNAATIPTGGTPAADTGYSMRFDASSPGEMYRAGTFVQWMTIGTPAPGDTIELRRVDVGGGSVDIRCYVNGTLLATYTDSSPLTGGHPGWGQTFRDDTQGMTTFDNASAGDSSWTN